VAVFKAAAIRDRRLIALNAFAVAFIVRAYWALKIQSPFNAVYSDMGGYVSRAQELLAQTTPIEPRILALWPWGTHAIVACELAVFGHSPRAVGICHAFVGAIPAACAVLLTARFVTSRAAIAFAGMAVALWHPHIVYTGFFSSEIWFTAALWIFTMGFVRHCEGQKGALAAGLALAVCFVVRPQILLTCMMIAMVIVVPRWRSRFRPQRGWGWAAIIVPLAAAMIFSSVRLHQLTGKYGLIAAYQPVQRLFGETNVGKIEANWITAKGVPYTYWFSPRTKQPLQPEHVVHIEGFICDPEIIASIRKERLHGVPWSARIKRMIDNVGLLAIGNEPWPEDDFRADPRRARLQKFFGRATLVMIPLAFVGLFFLRRHFVAQLLVWANLATIVIVAALYLGEARYRVPYDTFALVAATVALHRACAAVVDRWRSFLRRRRRSAHAAAQ
jgi:hypothetical protein